jgi:ribosome-binding factor A
MSNRRAERIASVIHAELARLLREEVKDPRVGSISITGVTLKPDLSVAKVRYLPLGGAGDRALVQAGLEASARFLRGPIGRALGIRHAPELRFELDANIEYAAHMDALLSRLAPAAAAAETAPADEEGEE